MSSLEKDDIELFRSTVGEVKPLANDRAEVNKPATEAIPAQLERDEQRAREDFKSQRYDLENVSLGDEVQYHRPGIQRSVVRKLRRGFYSVNSEIDLHGLTRTEAKHALGEFITDALRQHHHCVRIIHGKGLSSSNQGPVLKPLTIKWLLRCEDVIAFCTARAADGGTGALYVLLKN